MSESVQTDYAVDGDIAVITMQNPPVNGLGLALRRGIVESLRRAENDDAIQAIVLTGSGKAFSGGADIREFGSPKSLAEPNLLTVIKDIENAGKPVVAAVNATCMGGGFELALGCHYRVAAGAAQIALPEVKLGLLPGAGGTQRLPRVAPLELALNFILGGKPVPAEQFAGTRVFDRIVDGDPVPAAIALAREVVAAGAARPRIRDLKVDAPDAEAFLQFSRNMVKAAAKNFPAPPMIVDAVEAAATLPFDEGLARERTLFLQLLGSPESQALRHAFFGERAASKIADVPADTPLREIRKAAIIGAGTMGGGIAMNFANVGIPVTLLETKQEALDKGLATIRTNYENTARKGRLRVEDVERRVGLIGATLDYDAIADADIVIEAVFEDMAVKEQVFRRLDEAMKPGAILATNTSTLDVDRIAGFTKRPQDVVGLHFFSPANVMKLLEIVRGRQTAADVLATVMALAKKIRKTGVVAGVCDGFIGNRMIEQYFRQAGYLVEEGASPQQVDRAIERFGFAMGPFRMSDMAGNDVGWYIRKRRYEERPDLKYPKIADRICERGRFGQKTGAGFYRYVPGSRDALPDPEVDALIEQLRQELGITPRRITDEEIVDRLLLSLANEGAHILEEGIAQRASDIDMIYLTGYGFPPWRGGPMLFADQMGLYNVGDRMSQFARNPHGDPAFWTPAPLLARLAAEGGSFNG